MQSTAYPAVISKWRHPPRRHSGGAAHYRVFSEKSSPDYQPFDTLYQGSSSPSQLKKLPDCSVVSPPNTPSNASAHSGGVNTRFL